MWKIAQMDEIAFLIAALERFYKIRLQLVPPTDDLILFTYYYDVNEFYLNAFR